MFTSSAPRLPLVSFFSVLTLQIAKVEKLKPLEVELRRLEDLSESIVNDFAYMKKREEEMRDTNGKKDVCLLGSIQKENGHLVVLLLYNDKVMSSIVTVVFSSRVHKHTGAVLQYILHVLSHWTGHMAGLLPAALLQGKEADRVDRIVWLLSLRTKDPACQSANTSQHPPFLD